MRTERGIITPRSRCLLAAAAPRERDAVLGAFDHAVANDPDALITLNARFDLVVTGVGKARAAAMTTRALLASSYGSVLSVGVAGALPRDDAPPIGAVVGATRSVFADEGIGAPDRFIPMSELGFGAFPGGAMSIDHDGDLLSMLAPDRRGAIATVSWCSGTDARARAVAERTGAVCEAMEGAAVALAAALHDGSIRTGELRAISNTTGDRSAQTWDLDAALGSLTRALRAARGA